MPIPFKPEIHNQEWVNGETKLNQTNLTSGVNQNINNLKTAVDALIDAAGGSGSGGKIAKIYFTNNHWDRLNYADAKELSTRNYVKLIDHSGYEFLVIFAYGEPDYFYLIRQSLYSNRAFDVTVYRLSEDSEFPDPTLLETYSVPRFDKVGKPLYKHFIDVETTESMDFATCWFVITNVATPCSKNASFDFSVGRNTTSIAEEEGAMKSILYYDKNTGIGISDYDGADGVNHIIPKEKIVSIADTVTMF